MLSKEHHSVRNCRKLVVNKKRRSLVERESKKGSVGESKLKKGVNVATHPCHQFLGSAPQAFREIFAQIVSVRKGWRAVCKLRKKI